MVVFAKIANFAIFAKIASLQGATFGIQFKSPAAGDFSPVSPFSPLHAFLEIQFEYFATYRQPSGDFCQNCQFRQNHHFRQNRQPPRGHFWHPIQIASSWRFFASFAISAIACISGHKCFVWFRVICSAFG